LNIAPAKGLGDYREKFVTDPLHRHGNRTASWSNVVGDRVVVEANPAYWGPKPAVGRGSSGR